MAAKPEIRIDGNVRQVFVNGEYQGMITSIPDGTFTWKNRLAYRIDSPLTQGNQQKLRNAFLMLGYKVALAK